MWNGRLTLLTSTLHDYRSGERKEWSSIFDESCDLRKNTRTKNYARDSCTASLSCCNNSLNSSGVFVPPVTDLA